MHIHYTSGPEILADVSIELSNSVTSMLNDCLSVDHIVSNTGLSVEAIEQIDVIRKARLKRCCFCGELFDPKGHSRRMTCYKEEHYLPCLDCGKLLKVNESYANYMKAGGRRCPECGHKHGGKVRREKSPEENAAIIQKQHATMIERYGAATALQVPEMKAKIRATVKAKYGVDNLSQSKEIQDKIRENSQKRYGVDHYSNAPEVRSRMIQGMIDKYGVPNAQQNKEIQEKTKQTNLERYGVENVFQNEEIRKRFVDNHLSKYGVAWPHQRPELIEKAKQSNIDKYGSAMYPISDEYLRNFISDPSKFDNYKAFMSDPEVYISKHYVNKPSVKQLSEDLGVTDSPIYDKLISIGKRDLATEFAFTMETQVTEFIILT